MINLKYFLLLSTQLLPNYLLGHHSFTAEFTAEKTIIIEGVIKEVWFRNPHVRYLLEVSNENETEIWDLRGSPVVWLARKGWRRDSINIGDQISDQTCAAKLGLPFIMVDNSFSKHNNINADLENH